MPFKPCGFHAIRGSGRGRNGHSAQKDGQDITGIITISPASATAVLPEFRSVGSCHEKPRRDGIEECLQTGTSCGLISVDQLSAISTDGQHHHGGVPARFLKLLRVSEEDYAQRSKSTSAPCLACICRNCPMLMHERRQAVAG